MCTYNYELPGTHVILQKLTRYISIATKVQRDTEHCASNKFPEL